MARKFRTVDYEQSGQQTLMIDDCLPGEHLARFIVAIVGMLDLSVFYAYYAAVGGEPIDPKVLLGLLLYAYATGVFSSRKIEKATYEVIPFRFIAGGLHPDHSTIAWFRKQFLAEIKKMFAQVLLIAHETLVSGKSGVNIWRNCGKIGAHPSCQEVSRMSLSSTAISYTMEALCAITEGLPIGTNLGEC